MACPHCDDTGWRPVEIDGVRRVVRCECWRARLAKRALDRAKIPPRYSRCGFDNFVIYENEGLKRAFGKVRRFAEQFPVRDPRRGLCIIGPHGVGKTHLAVAALRHSIVDKGATGLYYETSRLLHEIRATYSAGQTLAESEVIRPVIEAELLVLDDLGKEKPSEWVFDTLNLVVDGRYNEDLLTIFISNFEDTPDHEDPDSLLVRVGSRIHSRLHEMCEFVEYDGADYRERPPNAGPEDLLALWQRRPKRKTIPAKTRGPLRAQLRGSDGRTDLKWSGGKAGR